MHPAAAAVPAEVRSCTGRGVQEELAQLRVPVERGSLFSGVNGMAQSKLRARGSLTCAGKFLTRRRGGGNQWGGSALEAGSLSAGVLIRFHLWLACPVGTRSCSTAVGKVGLPRCAWCKHLCAVLCSLQHVQFNSHRKECPPSCWLCHGVSPACQEGAEPAQVERCLQPWSSWLGLVSGKEALHEEKTFQVQ